MLNRLLIIVHWLIYGFVLLCIFSVALLLAATGEVDTQTQEFFRYSVVSLALYIFVLWLIKRKWIYFPWQHNEK